ncbi:hypothetical protein JCM8547_001367 [Rhodosporidiobolus lusitaniae]
MPTRPPTRSHASAPLSRPGTARTTATTAESSAPDSNGDWILALLPSRGPARDVGVVALDKELGHVVVTQFTDSSTFVKTLHLCRSKPPSVLLVPQTALQSASGKRAGRGVGVAAVEEEDEDEEEEVGRRGARSEAALLVKSLQEAFPGTPVAGVIRKYWNEQAGFEFLAQFLIHDADSTSVLTACKSHYYALSAACALFKYLETAHGVTFTKKSLKIRYAPLEGTCAIDRDSARDLELVANLLSKSSKQHLLGMLNKCYTPMGTRLLRSNILGPLTDPVIIDTRLDTVEELVNSEERFRAVRKALEPLKSLDLDKITSRLLTSTSPTKGFSSGGDSGSRSSLFPSFSLSSSSDPSARISAKLTHLLSLRTFLTSLPLLRSSVEGAESTLLRQVERILSDERLDEVARAVREGVNQDVWAAEGTGKKGGGGGGAMGGGQTGKQARLFAIRAERKRLLDVARETYRENVSDAHDLADALRVQQNDACETLETLSLVPTGNSGFVLQVTKDEWEEKGGARGWKGFVNVSKKGKKIEMSTLDLKKRNARILESEQEILLMSDEILDEMFDAIRGNIACLYRSAEALAMLDMLAAFADVSGKNDYVRPEWTDTLAIKAGRHPLHEQFRMTDGSFVPNDTYADQAASFQLIYGPNMSGKSTLLRQTALLHVVAQIGCYVPALYASFRPISALLTRLSNDDSIESSLSTFASEMTTMSSVLSTLHAHNGGDGGEGRACLVIVDELGRGTSPEEGVGIAHAIAEEIIKSKAFCFFATHFKELSRTLARYPNVASLHLETEIDPSQPDFSMTFHHRLMDGITPHAHYGLELAKIAKLPQPVLYKAQLVSATLASLEKDGKSRSTVSKVVRRRRELSRLHCTLREFANSRLSNSSTLLAILKDLQSETIQMLTETAIPRAVKVEKESEESLREGMREASVEESRGEAEREEGRGEEMLCFD